MEFVEPQRKRQTSFHLVIIFLAICYSFPHYFFHRLVRLTNSFSSRRETARVNVIIFLSHLDYAFHSIFIYSCLVYLFIGYLFVNLYAFVFWIVVYRNTIFVRAIDSSLTHFLVETFLYLVIQSECRLRVEISREKKNCRLVEEEPRDISYRKGFTADEKLFISCSSCPFIAQVFIHFFSPTFELTSWGELTNVNLIPYDR